MKKKKIKTKIKKLKEVRKGRKQQAMYRKISTDILHLFFFLIDERIDVDRLFLKKLITDRSIFGLEQLYRDTNYFIYIKLITF